MARSTLEDFVLRDKLGSGSYGTVWKVVRKLDRQTYALKEIDLHGMTRKEQEECIKETQVLSSLDSEHIIKYYDSFLEKGRLFIVTEYAPGGSLHDLVKRTQGSLPEQLIWRLFIQMLLGLHHMHGRKVLHRDFKALNVFLDDKLNVKLGDMGVAKVLSTHTAFAQTVVGTPYYLSPELCEDKPYNDKSDVWALGVCLYECCTKRHPFDAENQAALVLKILKGKYTSVTGYSKDLVAIISGCLTLDPKRRFDSEKLLGLKALRDRAAELGIALPPLQPAAKTVTIGLSLPNSASSSPHSSGAAAGAAGTAAPGMARKPSGHLGGGGGGGGSGSAAAAAAAAAGVERSGGSASSGAARLQGLARPKSGKDTPSGAAGPVRVPSALNAAAAAKAAAAAPSGSRGGSAAATPREGEAIAAVRPLSKGAHDAAAVLGELSAALRAL